MTVIPRSFRLVEIVLWVLGISLLGAAFGATFDRWQYQEQQERALFQGGPAVPAPAPESEHAAVAVDPIPAAKPTTTTPEVVKTVVKPVEKKRRTPALDPSVLGRLEIPRLDIAAIVKDGADERTLSRAIGRVPASARPGETGNMVLAGHRDTFFSDLNRIRVKDRIRLVRRSETLEYEVQAVLIVDPEDTGVLQSDGDEELTLVTCYPFRFVGTAPERFIVSALRVR